MIDEIHTYLVNLVRDAIGDRLSTIGNATNQYPAVIKYPTNAPQPDYQYAIVQLIGANQISMGNVQVDVDENDNPVYTQTNEITYQVRVYGDVSDSPDEAIRQLRKYLNIDSVKEKIREDTGGAFVSIFSMLPSYVEVDDRTIQSCSINLRFEGYDSIVDTSVTTIDNVIINSN